MKKLSHQRLTEEDLARLGLDDMKPGWYVYDPNNDFPYNWVGEYPNQEEVREAKRGLTNFYKRLDNPDEDDMLDQENEDDAE